MKGSDFFLYLFPEEKGREHGGRGKTKGRDAKVKKLGPGRDPASNGH
jgi:hypothetical protein